MLLGTAGVAQLVEQLICNQQVGGSNPSTSSTDKQTISDGGIPEWPKGADCKSVVSDFGGSNPPSPTKNELTKVSSFFLFCSGLENVSDTPVAYQSRSAACVEITLSSFYHKSKNIELPLGWLDIFFLSIFFASVLFRGGAFSFSAAGISRRTGIGGVRRGQTEENDCRGMLASTKNLSAKSRYHKNLAMSRINLQDSCYN